MKSGRERVAGWVKTGYCGSDSDRMNPSFHSRNMRSREEGLKCIDSREKHRVLVGLLGTGLSTYVTRA